MSNKEASIQLKLAKAKSLLAEADVLMKLKFYITVINRLYYSYFTLRSHYCLPKISFLKHIVELLLCCTGISYRMAFLILTMHHFSAG